MDNIVPATLPIVPRTEIIMFLNTSILVMSYLQKHIVYRIGGKIKANAAAAVAPINDMKLSSCGMVIAKAPGEKSKVM